MKEPCSVSTADGFEMPARAVLEHPPYLDTWIRATDLSEETHVSEALFLELTSFIVTELAPLSCSNPWAAAGFIRGGSEPSQTSLAVMEHAIDFVME